jgi:hypothetical protein
MNTSDDSQKIAKSIFRLTMLGVIAYAVAAFILVR